ncbi:unnamed protein product [Rotaria sp. Silwood1]|nr:unnamed protein product [Rotaria sp. Silwood1]
MVGVLPYSGCVFFTYESLKHIRLDYNSHRPINKTERMLYGAISGLIGQTASYPFDVVRRRLQTAAVIRPNERSLGAMATARKIIREEGITAGLYKGVTMNWMKGPISHPLSTKFDIISSLDSRIQWLKLTFGSAIQNSYCCFYPGRLLDEIYSVLDRLKTQQSFSNPCTLLQETRDMSSMAIEHFREQIKPKLQSIRITSLTTIRNNVSTFSTTINNSLSHHHKRSTNGILRRQIDILNNRIYKQNFVIKSQKYQMKYYKHLLHMRTKSLIDHHRRLKYLEKKSKESEQILLEIRKDNDTLLQRLDQFMLAYDNISTEINNKKSDEIFSQINTNLKRRKID